jgi:biopolymer transport protein ExbD
MPGKLNALVTASPEECKTDSSSMIDMVFQLILFFMVSSHFIDAQHDPEVKLPVAEYSKEPESADGRIIVDIHSDGRFAGAGLTPLADMDAITEYVRSEKEKLKGGISAKVLLRGDKDASVKYGKQVVQAAGAAGVNQIVFSAYSDARRYGGVK